MIEGSGVYQERMEWMTVYLPNRRAHSIFARIMETRSGRRIVENGGNGLAIEIGVADANKLDQHFERLKEFDPSRQVKMNLVLKFEFPEDYKEDGE